MKAVDRPELSHLVNVVVFSSNGERPACNKMSGGDLDGDVYFCCWDQELLKHLSPEQMENPGSYEKPNIVLTKPEDESLAGYFTFYL